MKFSKNQSKYHIIKAKCLGLSLIYPAMSKLLPVLLHFLHSRELLQCHILFSRVGLFGIIWQRKHLAQDEESSVPMAALELGPSASSSFGLIHPTLLTLLLVFAVGSVRIFHIFETSFCTICATLCDSSLKCNRHPHVSRLTLRTCMFPIVPLIPWQKQCLLWRLPRWQIFLWW